MPEFKPQNLSDDQRTLLDYVVPVHCILVKSGDHFGGGIPALMALDIPTQDEVTHHLRGKYHEVKVYGEPKDVKTGRSYLVGTRCDVRGKKVYDVLSHNLFEDIQTKIPERVKRKLAIKVTLSQRLRRSWLSLTFAVFFLVVYVLASLDQYYKVYDEDDARMFLSAGVIFLVWAGLIKPLGKRAHRWFVRYTLAQATSSSENNLRDTAPA